jgi:hypothetical protein
MNSPAAELGRYAETTRNYSRMIRRVGICVVTLLVACSEKTPVPDSTAAMAQRAPVTAPVIADSARAFAQRFYDWYTATKASQGEPYDSLLTSRRGWLADTLARALQADIAMQRADTIAEINSLSAEADIFLNSQDPCTRYTARSPRSLGAEGFAITIAGNCSGLDTKPNIEVRVRSQKAGWAIVTLKDPTDPTYDLLSAFAHYRSEMLAPHDSAGKDTWRTGSA